LPGGKLFHHSHFGTAGSRVGENFLGRGKNGLGSQEAKRRDFFPLPSGPSAETVFYDSVLEGMIGNDTEASPGAKEAWTSFKKSDQVLELIVDRYA